MLPLAQVDHSCMLIIVGVVEIDFIKPSMSYKPEQWLFPNCPAVSYFQWHPFTITSCPHDPYISIHVRTIGDFTHDLANAVSIGTDEPILRTPSLPSLRIDGPYEAPAEDVVHNKTAVLIGVGIGVTPWVSILREIHHKHINHSPLESLRRLEIIWVCKDEQFLEPFLPLLATIDSHLVHVYPRPHRNQVLALVCSTAGSASRRASASLLPATHRHLYLQPRPQTLEVTRPHAQVHRTGCRISLLNENENENTKATVPPPTFQSVRLPGLQVPAPMCMPQLVRSNSDSRDSNSMWTPSPTTLESEVFARTSSFLLPRGSNSSYYAVNISTTALFGSQQPVKPYPASTVAPPVSP